MKKVFYAVYILLFILILFLLSAVQSRIQLYSVTLDDKYYVCCVLSSLLFCVLGFLSSKRWPSYFARKKKAVAPRLLIFGIVLFAFGAIPVQMWNIWLGVGTNIFSGAVRSTYVNHAVNMLAGITIGSSLK